MEHRSELQKRVQRLFLHHARTPPVHFRVDCIPASLRDSDGRRDGYCRYHLLWYRHPHLYLLFHHQLPVVTRGVEDTGIEVHGQDYLCHSDALCAVGFRPRLHDRLRRQTHSGAGAGTGLHVAGHRVCVHRLLTCRGVPAQRLHRGHGYHCRHRQQISQYFVGACAHIRRSAHHRQFVSRVFG